MNWQEKIISWGLLLVSAACMLACIWTGNDRWARTAVVFLVLGMMHAIWVAIMSDGD